MAAARKILRGSDPDLWPPTSASERRARICRRLGWERPFLPHSERAPAWISKRRLRGQLYPVGRNRKGAQGRPLSSISVAKTQSVSL